MIRNLSSSAGKTYVENGKVEENGMKVMFY